MARQGGNGTQPIAKIGDVFVETQDGTQTTVKGSYIGELPETISVEAVVAFVDSIQAELLPANIQNRPLDSGSKSNSGSRYDYTVTKDGLAFYVRPVEGQKLTYGIVKSVIGALKHDNLAPVFTGMTFTFQIYEGESQVVGQGVLTQCKPGLPNEECFKDFGYN